MRWFHVGLLAVGAFMWTMVNSFTIDLSTDCVLSGCESSSLRCGVDRNIPSCNLTSAGCYCPNEFQCTTNLDCYQYNGSKLIRRGTECGRLNLLIRSCCWKRCEGDAFGYCRCKSSGLLGCVGGTYGVEVVDDTC
ncbi:uncharacterized protein LOC110855035 [Folsomia candida]|uniref:uncharacterized protein LOC110855035 n=1 Tax=Folsomia candida TaxID=158441 RepID=UPI000B8FA3D0|nr:uncharacterized protein LOC110855035 [Folsomia candida]